MRWGPVVASVVVTVALVAAGLTGISAFDGAVGEEYGLVRLDGMVGEAMVLLALALLVACIGFALGRVPVVAVVAVGLVTAVSASVSRASLSSDADLVREYIDVTGSATGVDSRLVDAAGGTVTSVDVDAAMGWLALGAAASLVVIGWAAWVELDARRRARAAAPDGDVTNGDVRDGDVRDGDVRDGDVRDAVDADAPDPGDGGNGPLTDPSQLPHT